MYISVHTQWIKELKSSLQALKVDFCINNDKIYPIELINKMRLEVGVLKVEWLIAWKGRIALEVTIAIKCVPTTQHCHKKELEVEYLPQPILTHQGMRGVGAKPTVCDQQCEGVQRV